MRRPIAEAGEAPLKVWRCGWGRRGCRGPAESCHPFSVRSVPLATRKRDRELGLDFGVCLCPLACVERLAEVGVTRGQSHVGGQNSLLHALFEALSVEKERGPCLLVAGDMRKRRLGWRRLPTSSGRHPKQKLGSLFDVLV